jgi:hypothetical protein
MKPRWSLVLDILTVLCLLLCLAILVRDHNPASRLVIPMLLPTDSPGALMGPGADQRVLRARLAAAGEVFTIEDVVRAAVAIERGDDPNFPPLSPETRTALREHLRVADGHRRALLEVETRLQAAEGRLGAAGREMGAALDPAQRRTLQGERDAVSVGGVEEKYWNEAVSGEKPVEGVP